jgi:hypothetical protein
MGLYMVKQIIEAHDGRIEVHSEPGHGTTFEIRLPPGSGELTPLCQWPHCLLYWLGFSARTISTGTHMDSTRESSTTKPSASRARRT